MSALKKVVQNIKSKVTSSSISDDESFKSPASSVHDSYPSRSSLDRVSARSPTRVTTAQTSHSARSPVRFVREKLRIRDSSESSRSSSDVPLNRDGEPMSRNQRTKHERQSQREQRRKEAQEKEFELQRHREEMEQRALTEQNEEQRARYGSLPASYYSGDRKPDNLVQIAQLSARYVGQEVTFRARIHNTRKMSGKLVFLVFRQQMATIQGVLQEGNLTTSYMMYWAEHLPVESVVRVKGILQEPQTKDGEVKSATIHDVELFVQELHVEAKVTDHLPFSVLEAEVTRAESEDLDNNRHRVGDRARILNRVLDLRTTPAQSIFRIQSALCNLFRSYLDSQGFIEIHTPKLQGGATESGASVFKIDYFGRSAFLAQSPQLAKQMCMSADFGRVYEVGPVFRAENSNTHRHLTEYTGLDLEMAIDEHYYEVLRVLDKTFKHIFKGIYEKYRFELEIVKRHFPHEDLVWLEETPVLKFADAVRLLNDSGWKNENGDPLPEDEDLGTRDEIQLGKVIKEKFGTDYYIIDKFPTSARPFYAMDDPYNPSVTNSFDIFLRGQEILSGGQRIHDSAMLLEKMEKLKVEPQTMEEYVNAFNWAAPPHGGGGIGLERMLMLLLNLGDIRHASLFPRDPKSLATKPIIHQLRHPEASTMHPPWVGKDLAEAHIDFQPIEKLIANYGDASNTSWLEERTQIWRDTNTGAAVGYVPTDGFAITVGDPLCHVSQYTKTIAGYLSYLKREKHLKPIWLLVGPAVEDVLATRFNWRTFSVVAEQRLNPSDNKAIHDSEIQRKIRKAERDGIRITDIPLGVPVPDDVREKIDQRVLDWLANRKGRQVHLTDIHPWQDMEHREYYYATDKDGVICGLVVLAQLSPEHGFQVKYSLDFPSAPNGAIEALVTHALQQLAAAGVNNVTFGGGASATFAPGHNLGSTRVKMLSKTYRAIVNELKLRNKSEFREKLGAQDDPVYVCYPPHGLGPMGIKAIMDFFGATED